MRNVQGEGMVYLEDPDHVALGDIYHSIMERRNEAFARYGANDRSTFVGPPTIIRFPQVSTKSFGTKEKRIGPFYFIDNPPVVDFCARRLAGAERPLRILEIGPGRGELARELIARFPEKIEEYLSFDRDNSLPGPWTVVSKPQDLIRGVDLIIAAEVIEHIPADVFVTTMLAPFAAKLNAGGAFIVSLPNPTSPGGIARDFTHVQAYPWYDLYAIFRLQFSSVDVFRTSYLYSAMRLATFLPRIAICTILEQEWAEGLVCIANNG